jgi:hypothetical protein
MRQALRALALSSLAGAIALFGSPTVHASEHEATQTVRVYHEAVQPTATSGSGIGAVRTFFIPMAVDGVPADGQYLSGTLTTLVDRLPNGQQLRASNLVFVFGAEADQLVVGGVSQYPVAGATLAPGQKTIRPVLGGSGKYANASGDVVSTNLGANGWTHVFRLTVPKDS